MLSCHKSSLDQLTQRTYFLWCYADPATLADPPKRIDYLFGTAKPIEAELVLRNPVHGLHLSDHLGLISTFDISADSSSPFR